MLKVDINLVFVIINILLFFALIRIFLFKPILGIIEKRKQMIEDEFQKAAETNQVAEKLRADYEASLIGAKEESIQIIEDARTRGKEEYDKYISDAEAHSRILIDKTNRAIEKQQEKAMQDVQSEIAGLAMSAVEKIIGEAGSEQLDKSLYDEFLMKAGTKE